MHYNYSQLTVLADTLSDLETARIACENRVRSLRDVKQWDSTLEFELMQETSNALKAREDAVTLALKRALRQHPLHAWVKRNPGLGEKTVARFLGLLGDPLQYEDKDEVVHQRTVASLWHYCGYAPGHDKRVKGEQLTYNPAARTSMYVIAEKCCMADGKPDKKGRNRALSPFRVHYDEAREAVADKVHDKPCPRCTAKGVSAESAIGKPWSDAHKHGHAMRMVAKHILRDLWIEADELSRSQLRRATQPTIAPGEALAA